MNASLNDPASRETCGDAGSFSTLVGKLVDLLSISAFERMPSEDRLRQINLVMSGINEYRVDANSLVRWGMSRQVWRPILILLIVTPPEKRRGDASKLNFDGWYRALGLDPAEMIGFELADELKHKSVLHHLLERATDLLPRWVQTAPMNAILSLEPPTSSLVGQIAPTGPQLEVLEEYAWLTERNTKDDLSDWSSASLRNEFRLREQTWVSSFPAALLAKERTKDHDLHRELAVRAVEIAPKVAHGTALLSELMSQALDFLAAQRFREAAALFEFYVKRYPEDDNAQNNLAFCLLPTDPEMALYYWDSINMKPFHAPAMLAYNRCLGLALVGRSDEALDLAESTWQRDLRPDGRKAFLWRRVGNQLELYEEDMVERAFALLAAGIAEDLGRSDRRKRWEDRASKPR
jgi:hypothetical protein